MLARSLPLLLAAASLAAPVPAPAAELPHPREVFGFEPGADYEIADYAQMREYYERLDAASDRVKLVEIGRSAQGRPLLLLFISSEENLARLEEWRGISETLARARVPPEQARALADRGRAIVWIDGGMHATERAHAQMTPLLAWKVASEETEEMRRIRDRVVLLLMPVMNPDGLDIVADWYRRNKDTPFADTAPPELYHPYVGHDNNRDWYMILQPESQAVSRVLYEQWYPQIVYNHHQSGPPWTRIFIPPFADPVNPRIPAEVITGVNLVGQAMHHRFALEDKDGVISRVVFSMWWNGGGRTAPYFHNMVGILSETGHPSPTPKFYDPEKRPETISLYGGRRAGTVSAREPSIYYPRPWKGGWLHFRDAIDYMITASMATLDLAARRPEDWLWGIYKMGRDSIRAGEAGSPAGWVVPVEQWDPGEAAELVDALRRGGVEALRADAPFEAGGQRYPAGSWVIPSAQAFRPYALDLLEEQHYPDRRLYEGGPPEPPYDLAGWTLPIQMGVRVDRIDAPFDVSGSPVDRASPPPVLAPGPSRWGYAVSPRANAATRAAVRLLQDGATVSRAAAGFSAAGTEWEPGTFVIEGREPGALAELVAAHGLHAGALDARPPVELQLLHLPRVGLYRSWDPSIDEGWTRWLLEQYAVPLETLRDEDLRGGDLSRFDAIVLPDQDADELLNGHPPGTMPEPYVGGVGLEGALQLERYARAGGTLVALDGAADFAIRQFGLPVRDVVDGLPREDFFIPGSLIAIEPDPGHPLAYGMPATGAAFFVRSRAFEAVKPAEAGERKAPPQAVEVAVRYAPEKLLLSGWALGEKRLAGKAAVMRARLGDGEVVLIGFRSQFRGQPRGTFKLLFDALLGATVEGKGWRALEAPTATADGRP